MEQIMLNDMIFVTRHGACPHEYEFDQKFKVDVWMKTNCVARAGASDALNLTINYADAYAIIDDIMYGEHVDLLETLAYRIGNSLIQTYRTIENVKVEVRKMQPPITNFNGTAAVSLLVTR